MSRSLVVLVPLGLFVAFGNVPSVSGDEPTPAQFHSTSLGDKLVYEMNINGKTSEIVNQVTGVEKKGKVLRVTTRATIAGQKNQAPDVFELSENGVFQVQSGTELKNPPLCVIPTPVKKGDSWEETIPGGADVKVKYTVAGEEEIEVPAGKFRCVLIESGFDVMGVKSRTKHWVALGYGMIKDVMTVNGFEVTTTLKSFTPGTR